MIERKPQKAPLPCFGLEHDRYNKTCRECPHADACSQHMPSHDGKIPLDKLRFDILPENYRVHTFASFEMDDPELPYLQRLYADCYESVFHRNALENVTRYKDEIAANARKADCSVRMFILANMVAHEVHEAELIEHTEKGRAARFAGKLLTGKRAVTRAQTYQDICKNRYGTFNLKSLEVLTDDDKDPLVKTMLASEVTAANWLVAYKIHNGVPKDKTLLALYEDKELQLAPEWLALQDSYVNLILKPYVDRKTGTETLQRHRSDAFHVHSRYKQRPATVGRIAWLALQEVLPETVRNVLSNFGYRPNDFLYPREPVTDMINFWLELGTAIRHNHCWRFLNHESSYFTPRRNEERVQSS